MSGLFLLKITIIYQEKKEGKSINHTSHQPRPFCGGEIRRRLLVGDEKRSEVNSSLFWRYLSKQEGNGRECEGPAVLIAEVGLVTLGPVQHFIINVGDVQDQADHQRETWESWRQKETRLETLRSEQQNQDVILGAFWAEAEPDTRKDEEDSRDEGQDGAMGADVADVTEDKTDEHEEETDQREWCGRADHLWKTNPPVIPNRSGIKYSFHCTFHCFLSDGIFPNMSRGR